jgi:hypothetical protein
MLSCLAVSLLPFNFHLEYNIRKYSMKIANRPFEDMAEFKYLGTTLMDQTACTKR